MSPADVDAAERYWRARFAEEVSRQVRGYVRDRRAAGATDGEIAAEIEAEKAQVLASIEARMKEIRPLIVRAAYGLEGASP